MNRNGYNAGVTHHRQHLKFCIVAIALPFLVSCLTVEVELDLRQEDRQELTMRYTMARQLWELGVFDDDSPERAVPVSRRDAEETALRHPGVSVRDFSITDSDTHVTVTVQYQADSFAGLQGVWGEAGGEMMTVDRRSTPGESTLSLPIAPGGTVTDSEQQAMIEEIFSGYRTQVTVLLPSPVATAVVAGVSPGDYTPQVDRSTAVMEVPMALVATSANALTFEVTW